MEGGGIVRIEDVSWRARGLGEWREGKEKNGNGNGKGEMERVADEEWKELVERGLVPRERVFDVPEEIRKLLEMN